MGVGTDEANVLGPLQNKAQFDIVASLVEAAKAAGGRVLLGGDPDPEQVGFFYPTTLIADLDHDNPLVRDKQFGPALAIVKYSSVDEALGYANDLDIGLALLIRVVLGLHEIGLRAGDARGSLDRARLR